MNEVQVAQMEAFIERNNYTRAGFEDYRGERIFVAERKDEERDSWAVIWSTMGIRRYLLCRGRTTREQRQTAAVLDARGFIDQAKTIGFETRH